MRLMRELRMSAPATVRVNKLAQANVGSENRCPEHRGS
jgi:hypothetical protein